MKKQKT
jgi:hypothetical protein